VPKLRNIGQELKHRKIWIGVFLIILAVFLVIGITKSSMIIDEISFVFLTVSKELERSNSSLPSVVQNLGLMFLGILIPLAIAILTDLYQKKGGGKEFSDLDIRVILDHVFKIKPLLLYGSLTFLPFIFWENYNGAFRLFAITLSSIGICLVVNTIIDVYNWTRGDNYTYRFSYLKKLKNPKDLEVAWRSVWQSKDMDGRYGKDFFDIFSSKTDKIITKFDRSQRNLTTILNDFLNSLDNRSPFFFYDDKMFLKIFEWDFIVWKLSWQNFQKRSDESTKWIQLSMICKSIIRKMASRTFKEKYMFSVIFMKTFQNHVELHKNEHLSVENRERYYVEGMFRTFFQILFEFEEVTDYGEKDYMWSVFPNEWKITKENLINKENIFSKISLNEFLQWTNQRLLKRLDFDSQLNDVSINLFPEVEPATWANILIFVLSPYDPRNRVNSIISVRQSFGFDMKPTVFSLAEGGLEKHLESERLQKEAKRKNAYELAVLIFRNIFTKENLKSYIEEATVLKYPDTSTEESKRQEFIVIFNGMQKLV